MTKQKSKVSDRRLTRASQLEQQAQQLRDEAEADTQAAAPKVGDRIVVLVPAYESLSRLFKAPLVEKPATVRLVHKGSHELIVDFDEWNTCDNCGQRTTKKWDRVKYDKAVRKA